MPDRSGQGAMDAVRCNDAGLRVIPCNDEARAARYAEKEIERIKGDVALFLRSYVPFNLSHLQTLHSDSTTEITEDAETKKPDYFLLRVLRVVEPVY
jgi:hypothetical protein